MDFDVWDIYERVSLGRGKGSGVGRMETGGSLG